MRQRESEAIAERSETIAPESEANEKSLEVKMAIVIEGLKAESIVSLICEKQGIHQSVYYKFIE